MFLFLRKEQISQSERMLFCIADPRQMGVLGRTCTDRKVSATVGSCSHGIQDKVCWLCLFCLMGQQHCGSSFTFIKTQLFEMVLTSSKRINFSLDNDICNGLVQWTSVVMVSVLLLARYVSGFLFVWVN